MAVKEKNDEHGLPSVSIVMGYLVVKDCKTLGEKVDILYKLGYGRHEIAKICGTTLHSVSAIVNDKKPLKVSLKKLNL